MVLVSDKVDCEVCCDCDGEDWVCGCGGDACVTAAGFLTPVLSSNLLLYGSYLGTVVQDVGGYFWFSTSATWSARSGPITWHAEFGIGLVLDAGQAKSRAYNSLGSLNVSFFTSTSICIRRAFTKKVSRCICSSLIEPSCNNCSINA